MKVVEKVLRAVLRPIEANAVTFVALYVLGVVSAWLTVPHTPTGRLYDNLYLELFLDLYVLCAVLACLGSFPRRVVKFLVCLVLYAVAIADVYCFEKYGSSLTPSMLMLVGETDSREAGEFLSSVLSWETLTSGVGWLLLIAVAHVMSSSFLRSQGVKESRSQDNSSTNLTSHSTLHTSRKQHSTLHTPHFTKTTLHTPRGNRLDSIESVLGLLALALLVWSVSASWKNKQGLWRLMTLNSVGKVENEITRYHRAEQYLPIYRLAFSIRANQLAARQVTQLVDAAGRVSVDSCSFTSPTIVLIIGESYNKHHSQLYGYYMPTTPRQVERERSGQLVKFTDVVTPWNLTSFVFKHMFSLRVVGQEGDWCDYPLFPEVFKQAGYDVTFLTNQFLTKAKDAVYDFSGGFFLNNPQLSEAMFDHRNTQMHPWDDGLLRDWDEMKSNRRPTPQPLPCREGSNLVIFHLLGQHMNYYSRYPKRQSHFTAEDYEPYRPKMLARRKQQLVWYDNAVLYNDSIVDQIIRRFEQDDAVVVYVPDHGEEIFEPGRFVICRNHTDDIDYPLAYYEYEVPFWVWCSKKYIANHPDLFQQIRSARSRPMMTDALPHMLLYLAGIHSADYRPEFNILADDYDATRPRLLKGIVDYDTLTHDMSSKRSAKFPEKLKKKTEHE